MLYLAQTENNDSMVRCLTIGCVIVSEGWLRNERWGRLYLYLIFVSDRPGRASLRSAQTRNLDVPRTRLRLGERAFQVAAPTAWNKLPEDIKCATTTALFKKKLKTFLFKSAYISWLYVLALLVYCKCVHIQVNDYYYYYYYWRTVAESVEARVWAMVVTRLAARTRYEKGDKWEQQLDSELQKQSQSNVSANQKRVFARTLNPLCFNWIRSSSLCSTSSSI